MIPKIQIREDQQPIGLEQPVEDEGTRRTGTPWTDNELKALPPVPRSYIVTPGTVVSIIIILVVILIMVILASVGVQF